MRKIYLSGKITNLPADVAEKHFEKGGDHAVKYLQKVRKIDDPEIINPMEIRPFLGLKNWLCYMISDIRIMRKCDTVYHLHNWHDSPGATIEHYVALRRKMNILYHRDCKQELKTFYKNNQFKKQQAT